MTLTDGQIDNEEVLLLKVSKFIAALAGDAQGIDEQRRRTLRAGSLLSFLYRAFRDCPSCARNARRGLPPLGRSAFLGDNRLGSVNVPVQI